MGRRVKLGGAIIFTFLFISCCVISLATSWYKIQTSSNGNEVTSYFSWTMVRRENTVTPTIIIEQDYSDQGYDKIQNTFNSSLVLLVIGGFIGLVVLVLQVIGMSISSKVLKILSGILLLLATAAVLVSFLQFVRINKAFDNDLPECNDLAINIPGMSAEINLNLSNSTGYCDKFRGEDDNVKYGPILGWYIMIGSIAFGFISALASFCA
ncbi:hypothetical protein CYY_002145 [Polysphondylium violaceum]|uniref:Transmembrane protein n=1 Tax=Polysphondylium violaceum TaxID=133409 RepID=A0A8J4UVF5_9MYCE|nr:hypothetical protein CYY_002145 [Polysphondylium violaceum]